MMFVMIMTPMIRNSNIDDNDDNNNDNNNHTNHINEVTIRIIMI